ncbi:MAG: hypothetical protein JWP89_4794 [Schlesneria sp.]|nr:hypothetical protein [Schlesneria sp.]
MRPAGDSPDFHDTRNGEHDQIFSDPPLRKSACVAELSCRSSGLSFGRARWLLIAAVNDAIREPEMFDRNGIGLFVSIF